MNCKFCGNFLPDGSDSCPVCGRRQDEQPIGKLLSENMPNPVAAEEAREEATKNRKAAATEKKPVSLGGPIALMFLAAAAWVYGLANGVMDTFRGIFSGGESGAHLVSGSDFVEGSGGVAQGLASMTPLATGIVVLTVVGIIALLTFITRLVKNSKSNNI